MVTLVFKKHFTKGNLAGLTITDHLPFVNTARAWAWADKTSNNKGLDWVFSKVSDDALAWKVFDERFSLDSAIDVFEQWYEAWK